MPVTGVQLFAGSAFGERVPARPPPGALLGADDFDQLQQKRPEGEQRTQQEAHVCKRHTVSSTIGGNVAAGSVVALNRGFVLLKAASRGLTCKNLICVKGPVPIRDRTSQQAFP